MGQPPLKIAPGAIERVPNRPTSAHEVSNLAIVTPTEKVCWFKNLVRCCGLFEAILGSAFVDEEWGS